jgi:hypothetical protein
MVKKVPILEENTDAIDAQRYRWLLAHLTDLFETDWMTSDKLTAIIDEGIEKDRRQTEETGNFIKLLTQVPMLDSWLKMWGKK